MEIKIEKSFVNDNIYLFIVENDQYGRRNITIGQNGKEFLSNVIELGQKIEPFLEIPTNFFEELTKAILVYAEENDIKPKHQTFIEGELIATKKHLSDLQVVVNKLFSKR